VGIQTIGTTDPVSLLNTAKNNSSDFGAISMLKIHRNLGSANYVPSGAYPSGITGPYINNYPNGLEITSFRSSEASMTKGQNKSVALAVGSTHLMEASGGLRTTCPATGFYVSDTGEQVAIGSTIDNAVGLSVTAPVATANSAITAYGDVNITGGNLSVTGSVYVDSTVEILFNQTGSTGNHSFFGFDGDNIRLSGSGGTEISYIDVNQDAVYLNSASAKGSTLLEVSSGGVQISGTSGGGGLTVEDNVKILNQDLYSIFSMNVSPGGSYNLTSLSGGNGAQTWLGPLDTDIIFNVLLTTGSGDARCDIEDSSVAGGFYVIGCLNGYFTSFSAIIPAGRRFKSSGYSSSSNPSFATFSFRIQKFGR
jgi:hypothetical protein